MQHVALQIIRGVPRLTTDIVGLEPALESIDLMNAGGFSVKDDGWIPQIAALKNGGIRMDNPLATGSMLLAGSDGNVTETMTLSATEVDRVNRYALLSKLSRFRQYILDFQVSDAEIQPVYLCWQAPGAPGPQYALIINLEISGQTDPFISANYESISLAVEREPYWRPIPPGMHPSAWTYYHQGGQMYSGTANLVNQNVYNYTSLPLDSATPGTDDCLAAYIDIEASDIPGDAPALVNMRVNAYHIISPGNIASVISKVMISRYSRPTTWTTDLAVPGAYQLKHTNTLQSNPNGGGSMTPYNILLGTNAATVADTGARGRKATCGDADVKNRVDISYGTQTNALRMTWNIDPTVMAGTYAVFLRGGQRGGALGDQSMYLAYGFSGDDMRTDPVAPELTDAGPSEFWGVTYMGTVSFPTGALKVNVLPADVGVQISNNSSVFSLNLWASRSTGTSTLYIQDLVLMPIDEPNIVIEFPSALNAPFDSIYDNTGYGLHGGIGDMLYSQLQAAQLQGSNLVLEPGVQNRLYFFASGFAFGGTYGINKSSIVIDPGAGAETDLRFQVIINILPRWRGVRSV